MTIDDLKKNDLIILECISGSKAYGLNTPSSDTDIKGVFLLPKRNFFGLDYIPQIANETNDIVYYELGRFMELLSLNNPNILELLNTPTSSVLYKHPYLNKIDSSLILSKLCKNTFGKFAMAQIKKAKGLNKKILNPIGKERKGVLSFCYVSYGQGSLPLNQFLKLKNWSQENCGLVNINHMNNVFALFYNEEFNYNGIVKNELSNDIRLSAIPKEEFKETILYFNKDGYSKYCKDYKEYWDWVENRNDDRYQNTMSHGKNYDAKNMMHTFRLLQMAIEIGRDKEINVFRPNRDFLLGIKNGNYEYNDLLEMANNLQDEMTLVFEQSDLQDKPNVELIKKLTYELRDRFYNE